MTFSLRQFLCFVLIVCLALRDSNFAVICPAGVQRRTGIVYFVLERRTRRLILCSTLFGIGIYTIVFAVSAELLAPLKRRLVPKR